MFNLDFLPSDTKLITPEEFLSLSKEEKMEVDSSTFVPPAIGASGFGHFLLKLKMPTYPLQ